MTLLGEIQHGRTHTELLAYVQENIVTYRDPVGISLPFVIESLIVCPQEMPACEGMMLWEGEVLYARMRVRCDLPFPLMRYIVVHELYELYFWETADIFMSLAMQTRIGQRFNRYIQDRYRAARNRQIELLTTRLLGYPRPCHPFDEGELFLPVELIDQQQQKGA